MKAAFVFSGQGSQYPGMGRDLYENSLEAKAAMDNAGEDILKMCFLGSSEELRQTEHTQACIYTVAMGAYEAFKGRCSLEPSGFSGFSLGEYAALTAAGYIESVSQGVEILRHRGKWMAEVGSDESGQLLGSMAAAMGSPDKVIELVEKTRGKNILTAANFNAPTQTVVSGEKVAVERFCEAAKEAKLRVTPLSVSGAFHSEMMAQAGKKLREYLLNSGAAKFASNKAVEINIPVLANYTAKPVADFRLGALVKDKDIHMGTSNEILPKSSDKSVYLGASDGSIFTSEDFAELMGRQLMNPVLWVDIIRNFIEMGVDTFIEFGPGKTLSGLIKKIDKSVTTLHVENMKTLEETLKEIKKRS